MTLWRMLSVFLLLAGAGSGFHAAAQTASARTTDARTAGTQAEEAIEGDWISYRDAYRLMIRFDKYGKSKNLIQSHLQVVPVMPITPMEAGATLDDVRLILTGPATHLQLPLDPAGRAVFPFLKSAYDDNARLVVNRKPGRYAIQPRISIAPRADGSYDAAELRNACQQALEYLQATGSPGMQDKQCAGVRFSYAPGAGQVQMRFRGTVLPSTDAPAFPDTAGPIMRTVTLEFGKTMEPGHLSATVPPVAIAPVFR
jgi:hypothetical protein